jgi:hypothetical protein
VRWLRIFSQRGVRTARSGKCHAIALLYIRLEAAKIAMRRGRRCGRSGELC